MNLKKQLRNASQVFYNGTLVLESVAHNKSLQYLELAMCNSDLFDEKMVHGLQMVP